ncbi:hypothetical protein FBQ96_03340, partial [Nitrospirales bacterium NOB]|nr:hypothetical protein [Nitrospirales bacterium NOB]
MKHRRTLVVPVLTAVFLTGVACSHTIPKSSSQPVPPPITSAVPSFTAMAKEDAPAPVSHVPVQVKTDLTPIQTAIRQAVPDRLTETGHPLEQEFRWTFVRTGEPHVHIQDGLVAIHAEYKGDIEARGSSRACRLDPVYATLDATGTLLLVQSRETLSFAFDLTHAAVGTKPESDARCNMFNRSINEQLPELFSLTQVKTAMVDAVHPEKQKALAGMPDQVPADGLLDMAATIRAPRADGRLGAGSLLVADRLLDGGVAARHRV